jgi:hypothetical protein
MADADEAQSKLPGLITSEELRKSYDSLLRSLQALSGKLSERRTAAEVQELSLRLGYFALALNHQMDGNAGKAESALARADARSARLPAFFKSPDVLGGEDLSNVYH